MTEDQRDRREIPVKAALDDAWQRVDWQAFDRRLAVRLVGARRRRRAGVCFALVAVCVTVGVVSALVVHLRPSPPEPRPSPAAIMAKAAGALDGLAAIRLAGRLRARPLDGFATIHLDADLVPFGAWKQFGERPKWRIERPGCVVTGDGRSPLMLVGTDLSVVKRDEARGIGWLSGLLDLDRLIERELRLVLAHDSDMRLSREVTADGSEELIVTVTVRAEEGRSGDWLTEEAVARADNRRVYRFDAATGRFVGLEVYVPDGGADVLVLEIGQVDYDPAPDPALFAPSRGGHVVRSGRRLAGDYAEPLPLMADEVLMNAVAAQDWRAVRTILAPRQGLTRRPAGSGKRTEARSLPDMVSESEWPPFRVGRGG